MGRGWAYVAAAAVEKNIPTLVRFFGVDSARELVSQGKSADVLIGNNVLAQVPDINDFVGGMKILLAPRGVITVEFPHLLRLPSLWTTAYFASTAGNVSQDTIRRYIEAQSKRD